MDKQMKLMTNVVPLAIFIVGLVGVVTICWVTYDSMYAVVKYGTPAPTDPAFRNKGIVDYVGNGDDKLWKVMQGMKGRLFVHSDDEDAVFEEGMHKTITVGDLAIIAWLQDTNDQIRDTHRILNYIAVILIGSFIVWCVQQIALYVRLQFSFQVRK